MVTQGMILHTGILWKQGTCLLKAAWHEVTVNPTGLQTESPYRVSTPHRGRTSKRDPLWCSLMSDPESAHLCSYRETQNSELCPSVQPSWEQIGCCSLFGPGSPKTGLTRGPYGSQGQTVQRTKPESVSRTQFWVSSLTVWPLWELTRGHGPVSLNLGGVGSSISFITFDSTQFETIKRKRSVPLPHWAWFHALINPVLTQQNMLNGDRCAVTPSTLAYLESVWHTLIHLSIDPCDSAWETHQRSGPLSCQYSSFIERMGRSHKERNSSSLPLVVWSKYHKEPGYMIHWFFSFFTSPNPALRSPT